MFIFVKKENNESFFSNSSLTIGNQVDGKFCRVLYTNDGSSTMIQTSPGQTVYQILRKIFNKKQIPWYKCDLYYLNENNVRIIFLFSNFLFIIIIYLFKCKI